MRRILKVIAKDTGVVIVAVCFILSILYIAFTKNIFLLTFFFVIYIALLLVFYFNDKFPE